MLVVINYRLVYGISQSQRLMSRGSLHDFGIWESEVCGCNFFLFPLCTASRLKQCAEIRGFGGFPRRSSIVFGKGKGLLGTGVLTL